MKARLCPDCGERETKGARCRPCAIKHLNSDPSIRAKRNAGLKQSYARPEVKARHSEVMRQLYKDRPDLREARSIQAKARNPLWTPQAIAARATPEAKAKQAQSLSRTKLRKAGVPLERREQYLWLLSSKKLSATQAAAQIRAEMAKEERARIAATELTEIRFFLQRLTVVRPEGDGWRYGTTILTTDELVQRALQKGYQPRRAA